MNYVVTYSQGTSWVTCVVDQALHLTLSDLADDDRKIVAVGSEMDFSVAKHISRLIESASPRLHSYKEIGSLVLSILIALNYKETNLFVGSSREFVHQLEME